MKYIILPPLYLIVAAIQGFFFSYAGLHLAPVFLSHPIILPFWKWMLLALIPVIGQVAFPAFILAVVFGV